MNGVNIKNFADFFHGENKTNWMEKIKEFGDCFHDEKKT